MKKKALMGERIPEREKKEESDEVLRSISENQTK